MSEVLVLVDQADGAVKKVTLELLTLARNLGEPSAVVIGSGVDTAPLAEYGAANDVDITVVNKQTETLREDFLTSSLAGASPEILWTLMFNLAAFTVIYVYLMMRRVRLAKLEGELEQRMAYHG